MEEDRGFPVVLEMRFGQGDEAEKVMTATFMAFDEQKRDRLAALLVAVIHQVGEMTSETPPLLRVAGEGLVA